MIRKIKKNKWELYLRHDGKRYRKRISAPSQAIANRMHKQWENDIYDGFIDRYRLFDKLNAYLKYIQADKSEDALRRYQHALNEWAGYQGNSYLHEIKKFKIEDYIHWQRSKPSVNRIETLSNATLNRRLAHISCFFSWCVDRGFVRDNPCARTKLKENNAQVINFSYDQGQALIHACNAKYQETFIRLALFAGLRHSEILNLKWPLVNIKDRYLTFDQSKTEKGKNRIVPIPDSLIEHMDGLERSCLWVVNWKDKPMKSFKTSWSYIKKRIDEPWINNMRIHDMRHVYATWLRATGMPMSYLKEVMGHESVLTTERYAHYEQSKTRGFIEQLDKVG